MRPLLALFLAAPLFAAYNHLIATADGNSVYFEVTTSPAGTTWYASRAPGAAEAVSHPLADLSGDASVLAWSVYFSRYCGFAGSTCWLADPCQASFGIVGPSFSNGNSGNQSLVRLDRSGALAWIEQKSCRGLGFPQTAPLNGLYDAATLRPIAPANGATLANQRFGRRVLTDSRQALALAGPQLEWIDASGVHLIRNVYGAVEAVTDSSGANIVYSESGGELHWLTGPDWLAALDRDLHLQGTAPALTPDGAALLFLAPNGALQLYDRPTGALRTLTADTYATFTVAAGAAFAVTAGGRLVRIDLVTGVPTQWLAAFPSIESADAPYRLSVNQACPLVCYAPQDLGHLMNAGMLVVLHGDSMAQSGWRVSLAGVDAPLVPLTDSSAYFEVPDSLPGGSDVRTLAIARPDHPLRYSMQFAVESDAVVCLGTLHQDFASLVNDAAPAQLNEVVHVFLTGQQGASAPPPLAVPSAFGITYFGPAPGLNGMQQLDLRVLGAVAGDLFDSPHTLYCAW